jgi:hypothetical protein
MTAHRKVRAAADQNLFKIVARALDLNSQALAAGKAHEKAEQAMAAWKKRNPQPRMRRAYLWPEGNPDLQAAKRQHARALAQWKRREQKALKGCRCEQLEAAWEKLLDRLCDETRRAEDIRAASIDGLRCKARLVEIDGSDDPRLPLSIVNDLLALPASVRSGRGL